MSKHSTVVTLSWNMATTCVWEGGGGGQAERGSGKAARQGKFPRLALAKHSDFDNIMQMLTFLQRHYMMNMYVSAKTDYMYYKTCSWLATSMTFHKMCSSPFIAM